MDEPCVTDESPMPAAPVRAQPGMRAVKVDLEPAGEIVAVTERYAFLRYEPNEQPAVVPWPQIALHGVEPAPEALPRDVIMRDRQDKLAAALRHLLMIEAPTSTDRAAIERLWRQLRAPDEPRGAEGDEAS